MRVAVWGLVLGCAGVDEPDPMPPTCDGQLQVGEESVDAPFDRDGDGYFDASDIDCLLSYGVGRLDCDDSDPDLNPGQIEIPCNGINDDCNGETPDDVDLDDDGTPSCRDCDDENPVLSPDLGEICWDDVDNDCDDLADEDCPPNYNGTFVLDQPVAYACGSANLDFSEIRVQFTPPSTVALETVDSYPGSFDGVLSHASAVDLLLEFPDPGACNERYTLVGTFTTPDLFEGTLTADWGPWKACAPCKGPLPFEVIAARKVAP